MSRSAFVRLLLTQLLLLSSSAQPAENHLHFQLISGVMLQPNSQYFHSTYGGAFTLSSPYANLHATLSYIERPKFSASGFSDQEAGVFLVLGREIPLKRNLLLSAAAGIGRQQGFLESPRLDLHRNYHLDGLSTLGELRYSFSPYTFSLIHQTFVGIDGHEQLRSYVAWPFNFFNLAIGFSL